MPALRIAQCAGCVRRAHAHPGRVCCGAPTPSLAWRVPAPSRDNVSPCGSPDACSRCAEAHSGGALCRYRHRCTSCEHMFNEAVAPAAPEAAAAPLPPPVAATVAPNPPPAPGAVAGAAAEPARARPDEPAEWAEMRKRYHPAPCPTCGALSPTMVFGKPSARLRDFSAAHSHLVRLGGCMRKPGTTCVGTGHASLA